MTSTQSLDTNHQLDFLFEISWEVCHKVGGIYTVLSTKSTRVQEQLGDQYITIGPDVWMETVDNPDFVEDRLLFHSWKEKAEAEGIKCRIGRWQIPSKPIAILVDFTPLFGMKDTIFAEFWETYKLDSISGQWDYIEPALFGYMAGKVIESFSKNNFSPSQKVVAHFHEWMTGMGVLYLKKYCPLIGTAFTTHATSLGRSIASHGFPLYKEMTNYKPETMADNLHIRSKHSLERLSAIHADAFTTVSEVTAKECSHFLGKAPDIITPNGFDESYIPDQNTLLQSRSQGRQRLLQVASAMTGTSIHDDALLIMTSGRYEYRNKGLDLLLEAIGQLPEETLTQKQVVVFIMVPANQSGPNPVVQNRLSGNVKDEDAEPEILTHTIHDLSHDIMYQRIMRLDIRRMQQKGVHIIFTPAYLNGTDGIFNMEYYSLLAACDLSVFPSYYEPWGYTPLESLAFGVPTVTTSLTGFGVWMDLHHADLGDGLHVIPRKDGADESVVVNISSIIQEFRAMEPQRLKAAKERAIELSHAARWSELISHYFEAYALSLEVVSVKRPEYTEWKRPLILDESHAIPHEQPEWKKILINLKVPDAFKGLERMALNLWWTWNSKSRELFEQIDPQKWLETEENPVALLESLSVKDYQRLSEDAAFMDKMTEIVKSFDAYMAQAKDAQVPLIAYFSMEYGLHDSIKIYSGGLGVLAGDYLKEASDNNLNMIGVGLLYRFGYFRQIISLMGDQIAEARAQKFTHLPVIPVRDKEGQWIMVKIALPGRTMYAKVWRCDVGRIPLYLLDTDIEENEDQDKTVTYQLYGGDWDNRFKQELLLGVGGIRVFEAIGIKPDLYHCNEGHAAFTGVERLRQLVQEESMSFAQALEIVRASTLFTTHTPVPAGHDYFTEDTIRTYIPHYADRLNLTWSEFLDLGRFHPGNTSERFSMSVLAARLSQAMNGVSAIHGRISRKMFQPLFPGYFAEELHIGHVTNGVHYPTWTGRKWRNLHEAVFSQDFTDKQDQEHLWKRIQDVPDEQIWELRSYYRARLVKYLRQRVTDDMTNRQENPGLILRTVETMNEQTLTLGFARRFATYKRAHLLFTNLKRLSDILNKPGQPVQLFFAGKAHPSDKAGQDLIKRIIEISRMPEFAGKIVFVENYDLELGKKLVQGVDVWLNTPTRPLEASGTSGEKAVMNGVLNFSVLDGWWSEGYQDDAGWAIREERTYENQEFQDQLDAETIYNTLEESIIPLFYQRDEPNRPAAWIKFVKNTIAHIAPRFTMKRMLDDYIRQYYQPLHQRTLKMRANGHSMAKALAHWKDEMRKHWNTMEIISVAVPDATLKPLELGELFNAEIRIKPNGLTTDDLGIEVVFGRKTTAGSVDEILFCIELEGSRMTDGTLKYVCSFPISQAGVYDYAFRLFPKHPELPHRQDFPLIKWI